MFWVGLVPGCGWFAGLEDGSECGALGVGEGWGVVNEVLDVRGEGVGVGGWGCAVVLTSCGAGGRGGYGRGVGTSPPDGRERLGAHYSSLSMKWHKLTPICVINGWVWGGRTPLLAPWGGTRLGW